MFGSGAFRSLGSMRGQVGRAKDISVGKMNQVRPGWKQIAHRRPQAVLFFKSGWLADVRDEILGCRVYTCRPIGRGTGWVNYQTIPASHVQRENNPVRGTPEVSSIGEPRES